MRKGLRFLSLLLVAALVALTSVSAKSAQAGPPDLDRAIEAHKQHSAKLLANPDVVATGVGLTDDGKAVVKVFTAKEEVKGLPASLDGVPVSVALTGPFVALQGKPEKGKPDKPPGGGGSSQPSNTDRWARPVPIGISTGNAGECSAGTIGARVKDTRGSVFALSNNHVYALENTGPIGSAVLQPGVYDTGCVVDLNNQIGSLTAFLPIVFDGTTPNTIDAAIAGSSTANLGNATPPTGYGLPKSATVSAFVGQAVQKYGRTTSLTRGQITAINASVKVGYGSGTALFVDQIIVQSFRPFIKPGDSGSLLVADPDRNPVGLLFAGSSDGRFAVANRIDLVLTSFGVTVDGE